MTPLRPVLPRAVAIEDSDVTLISGALGGVATAIRLSRATMRNIRQNLVLAFMYTTIGILIAAGVRSVCHHRRSIPCALRTGGGAAVVRGHVPSN